MKNAPRHKLRWLIGFTAMSLIVLGACATWGMLAYAKLITLDQAIVTAGAKVESASRVRLGLVENLIGSGQAFECVDPGAFDSVEAALQEVRARTENHAEPGRYGASRLEAIRASEVTLTAALGEFCSLALQADDASLEAIVVDLEPKLERWQQMIFQGLDDFELAVARYDRAVRSFPGSVVSSVKALELGGATARRANARGVARPAG